MNLKRIPMKTIMWLTLAVVLPLAIFIPFGLKALLILSLVCCGAALFLGLAWFIVSGDLNSWRWCSPCCRWHNGKIILAPWEVPPDHDGVAESAHYQMCRECKKDFSANARQAVGATQAGASASARI
jgi:hypothetical protein